VLLPLILFICSYFINNSTFRPYQVFYSKTVIYCKNALKLKLTKKYNLLVLVHFYSKLRATVLLVFYCKKTGKV